MIRDEATPYDGLNAPGVWGSSSVIGGTPGEAGVLVLTHFNAWQEVHFADTAWDVAGAMLADPDDDGILNWEEYAFGTNPMLADERVFRSLITDDGGTDYLAVEVRRRRDASDLVWNLQTSTNLESWGTETAYVVMSSASGDGTETVVLREGDEFGNLEKGFIRLQVIYRP